MILPRDIYGVTITGTRRTKDVSTRDLAIIFRAATEPFQTPNTSWIVGGATGIDTLFLEWLTDRCAGYIHVVVPRKLEDQPADAQKAIHRAAKFLGPEEFRVTELNSSAGSPECYFARNRWMVDRSQILLGFPHESEPSNGTMYTINYAASLGLPRIIWPVGK